MKFGGTSVRDAEAFARVGRIVATRRARRPIVVVSAMSRVTDALVASATAGRALANTPPQEVAANVRRIREESLSEVFARHRSVAASLLAPPARAEFERTLLAAEAEISDLLATFAVAADSMHGLLADTVVSHGERLSSALLAFALRDTQGLPSVFLDARRCIVTDDNHACASPDFTQTARRVETELAPLIEDGFIPVIGGFIGASLSGATTTLGRNGSDYSATIIAAATRASVVEIWTDTTGVLTADPRLVPQARNVARLSYKEAADLARAGAKVLHPKTIGPLIEHGIPLHVRNSQAFEQSGTVIFAGAAAPGAKSITLKRSLTSVQVTPALAGDDALFVELVCHATARHREDLDLCLISHAGALFVANEEAAASIAAEVEAGASVCVERHRALITIIGERMDTDAAAHARLLRALETSNISAIVHGASTTGRSFVVEENCAADAVARLHRELFET